MVRMALALELRNLPAAEALQERPRIFCVVARVRPFDHEEEQVARPPPDVLVLEHRVVGHRQAVNEEHPPDRREGREEDRQFVRDREGEERAEEGLPADGQRVVELVHVPDQIGRHAWQRSDWSSDVCSSDLKAVKRIVNSYETGKAKSGLKKGFPPTDSA